VQSHSIIEVVDDNEFEAAVTHPINVKGAMGCLARPGEARPTAAARRPRYSIHAIAKLDAAYVALC
jgi:hypothetical protein